MLKVNGGRASATVETGPDWALKLALADARDRQRRGKRVEKSVGSLAAHDVALTQYDGPQTTPRSIVFPAQERTLRKVEWLTG
jgi:hypothetical protein